MLLPITDEERAAEEPKPKKAAARKAAPRRSKMRGRGACFDDGSSSCRIVKGIHVALTEDVDGRAAPAMTNQYLPENIQRRVLQQHDGLGVGDAAVGDHGERVSIGSSSTSMSSPSSAMPPPPPTCIDDSYSATKKCSFSVTEPGLMKASNTFLISPSR